LATTRNRCARRVPHWLLLRAGVQLELGQQRNLPRLRGSCRRGGVGLGRLSRGALPLDLVQLPSNRGRAIVLRAKLALQRLLSSPACRRRGVSGPHAQWHCTLASCARATTGARSLPPSLSLSPHSLTSRRRSRSPPLKPLAASSCSERATSASSCRATSAAYFADDAPAEASLRAARRSLSSVAARRLARSSEATASRNCSLCVWRKGVRRRLEIHMYV